MLLFVGLTCLLDCLIRWDLIAGRIPGGTAKEIERLWIMRHHEIFAEIRRKEPTINNSKVDAHQNLVCLDR